MLVGAHVNPRVDLCQECDTKLYFNLHLLRCHTNDPNCCNLISGSIKRPFHRERSEAPSKPSPTTEKQSTFPSMYFP